MSLLARLVGKVVKQLYNNSWFSSEINTTDVTFDTDKDNFLFNKPIKIGSSTLRHNTDTGKLDVEADIDVLGTVNGRDVAEDGDKLDGIEEGAEVNQSDSEIKTQYESNPDTNAFTDSEKTKLGTISTGAEVNVKADWNSTTGDSEILNKPTDVTDLSLHNSSELSDGSDLVKNTGASTHHAIPLFNGTTGKVIKSGFLGTDGNTNINQLNEIGQLDINPYRTLRLGRLTNTVDFSVRVMVGNNSVHDNHKLSGSTDSYLALLHGNVSIGKVTATEKLDVEGNIKASGTVNGRDIAADGEKLDSIINASGGTFTNIVRSIDGTTLNEEITLFTVPADRTALINRLYLFTSQSEDYTADGELRIYFTPKGSGGETSSIVTNFGHPAHDTVFDLSTVLLEGSTVRLKVTTAITATTSNIICKADIIY